MNSMEKRYVELFPVGQSVRYTREFRLRFGSKHKTTGLPVPMADEGKATVMHVRLRSGMVPGVVLGRNGNVVSEILADNIERDE